MGGKKRPTVSQLEKRMKKELESKSSEKGEKGGFKAKLTDEGALTQASMNEILKEISKWSYITPFLLSSRFGLKISAAKQVLGSLEGQGVIKLVDSNRRTRIYVPS
ncbi:MAG: hypothetical protein QXY49_05290 [Thermofilaceae archaeon]